MACDGHVHLGNYARLGAGGELRPAPSDVGAVHLGDPGGATRRATASGPALGLGQDQAPTRRHRDPPRPQVKRAAGAGVADRGPVDGDRRGARVLEPDRTAVEHAGCVRLTSLVDHARPRAERARKGPGGRMALKVVGIPGVDVDVRRRRRRPEPHHTKYDTEYEPRPEPSSQSIHTYLLKVLCRVRDMISVSRPPPPATTPASQPRQR